MKEEVRARKKKDLFMGFETVAGPQRETDLSSSMTAFDEDDEPTS